MILRRELLFLLLTVVWFHAIVQAAPKEINQSVPIKALGTGRTTGHIADLVVKNKGNVALTILSQRVFIPSSGLYQPYIATIPAATIQPETTVTLQLQGYCTDVHLPAVPAGIELIPLVKWIPIRLPDSTLAGNGAYLVTQNSVIPFTKDHISYIITSNAYIPLYPPPDTLNIVTWPGTDVPTGGSMNHVSRPDLYATIMAKVLDLLEPVTTAVQERTNFATPFTIVPGKEREAIIQHVIWMYATSIAGKKYGKEEFRAKVYEQFKTQSSFAEIPALEKQELDEGIDEFWNIFITVAAEAKLFLSKEKLSATGVLVDLPIDTIQYPWSMVPMTDINMKPGFVGYVPVKASSPVIPIIAGTVSLASLLFIAFHEHEGDTDCVFSINLQTTNAGCNLENGAILLTTSIETEYEYLWSNGATSRNLEGIGPGTYSVTVTRTGTTCGQSAETVVENFNQPINSTITTTDAHCSRSDGSATVTVDPIGFYNYAWSNGSTDQNQTGLAAGSYTLIVNAYGICADTNTITINDIPASFNVEITNTPAHCGAADGTANAGVTPDGDYLYQWSEGSTTNSVSGLVAGTYSLTVTENSTGCTKVQQTEISDASSSFSINVSTTDATCGLPDGSATATVDPPGEYEYEWSGGQTTAAVSGLAPGVYSIKVSVPGTACSDSMEITIGELPPSYTINTSFTPASCGLNDGTASAVVDPNGPYEFSWSNGQTGPQVSGLTTGTYTVTVSLPGNLCTQTAEVSINQLPPSFTLSSGTTPAGCGLQDGTASAIVDPPGEYVFLWSNGQTTAQATGLAAGSYQVTVTIAGSSCQQSISMTVDQSTASFTVSTTSTAAQCGLNDGTASALVDPPGEYTYLWSDGQTTQQATGLVAGNYSVTVTLAGSSCQQSGSVTVDQLQASFSVSTTSTPSHCGLNDGTATALADPPGEYMYQWSNGQLGSQLTSLDSGQYVVSVSLVGSSCFVSDTISVDQISLSINASFAITPSDCGVANGSAAITIDPAGNYTYTWSNKQTGEVLQSVPAGNYEVTVTDQNSCTATFSTAVNENPAHYLDIISTTPATCIGGGDISFTLISPGAGPIQIDLTTPNGSLTLTLPAGSYLLSSLINVLPGTYNFNVFDQSIGTVCSENQSVQVTDQTPAISVTNDTYTTGSDQPVNGNVLQNDSGLNLQLTAVANFVGGTVTFTGDGSFTYTPNSGFSGTGSFDYNVTDACGNTASGSVTITVQMVACSITITSTLTPANCDLLNGAISISVNEPGTYQYNWSNGQTGSTINNIPAGTYTVTILETGSGCTEDFTLNLTEYPADYVSNIVITQPDCTTPGEIQFTLNTQGPALFLSVSVDHPIGIQTFTIEPGVVVLSDYIDIVEGSYAIEVFIGDAGPDCIDDFTATINAAPSVVIQAGQITPPSSQGAMDGAVNISVTDPGVMPYSIFVNDGFYGTTSSSSFQVTGLATGFYDIHIVDATGCMSNVVMVIIPLPTVVFSLGVALVNSPPAAAFEQPASGLPTYWNTGVLASMKYHIGKKSQRLRMLYSPEYSDYHFYHPAWMQVEHLSDILTWRPKQCSFSLEGGIGIRPTYYDVNYEPVYVSLNASTQINLGKILHLAAEVSLRGWSRLETPQWMINATFPFLK
jgi:hypothetical protein